MNLWESVRETTINEFYESVALHVSIFCSLPLGSSLRPQAWFGVFLTLLLLLFHYIRLQNAGPFSVPVLHSALLALPLLSGWVAQLWPLNINILFVGRDGGPSPRLSEIIAHRHLHTCTARTPTSLQSRSGRNEQNQDTHTHTYVPLSWYEETWRKAPFCLRWDTLMQKAALSKVWPLAHTRTQSGEQTHRQGRDSAAVFLQLKNISLIPRWC